jgi:hypothetical protein
LYPGRTVAAETEPKLMAVNQRSLGSWARRPEVRIGAVVAVAILVAFVVWLLVRGGGSSQPHATAIPAVAASSDRLRALSVEAGRPIYWLGPQNNHTYELTRTSQDRIYVRYLPKGTQVGTSSASYPLVGTYPVDNAYNVLKSLANGSGESSFTAPKGGFAVYSASKPTNVYLAYPGTNVQIEVFDPSPTRARELVASGQVVPVG